MMKKEFTGEDIIHGRNFADLDKFGEFRADYLEIDPENPRTARVWGSFILSPRHVDGGAVIKGVIEIALGNSLIGMNVFGMSAGEIFTTPWKWWHSFNIQEDWEF